MSKKCGCEENRREENCCENSRCDEKCGEEKCCDDGCYEEGCFEDNCNDKSCCGGSDGTIKTTSAALLPKDILGAWKVRWGFGRDNYTVEPGIYALGKPDNSSPVLVSANYKLSFDTLRKNLAGVNCWILVLDTKGVNVWCSAGKGTFGTDELVSRIETTGLGNIVEHRRLILPQLGATGVSGYEVKQRTGYTVIFGPVRANDIRDFISSGCKATKEMRTIKFTLWDRLVLTPMELVEAVKILLPVFGILFLINLFALRSFGLADFFVFSASVLSGAFITPVFLPLIPGRAFSFKGWLAGAINTALIAWVYGWFTPQFLLLGIGYMLAMPAHSAFLALNFTGASTYTSFSGVIKEMKIAIPLIIISAVIGVVLILIKSFMG